MPINQTINVDSIQLCVFGWYSHIKNYFFPSSFAKIVGNSALALCCYEKFPYKKLGIAFWRHARNQISFLANMVGRKHVLLIPQFKLT